MIISNKKLTEYIKKDFKKSELDDVELIFDYINTLIDDKNYGEHSIGVASRDLGVSSELFRKVAFYFEHSLYHEYNIHVLDPKVLGIGNTDEDYKEYVKLRNTCDLLIDDVSFNIYLNWKYGSFFPAFRCWSDNEKINKMYNLVVNS